MKRVLVTGATGFIGGHLASTLVRRGVDVKCLVRPTSVCQRLSEMGVRLVEGDITSATAVATAVKDVDLVYHLAGAVKSLTAKKLWRVNVDGTRNVVDACAARTTPPTLLLVSSIAAAGPSLQDRAKRESDPARPVSNYGRSKRGGEVAAAAVADKMPVTIVRPPIVFGPHDATTLMLFRPIKRYGVTVVPGSRQRQYSFIHSDDLVDALIVVAERGKRLAGADDGENGFKQGCYFVGYDPPVKHSEFANLVGQALARKRVRSLVAHDLLVRTGGRLVDVYAHARRQPQIFSLDKAREATAGSWTCSAELIDAECGYRPSASFAERVSQTAKWLCENGWLTSKRTDRD